MDEIEGTELRRRWFRELIERWDPEPSFDDEDDDDWPRGTWDVLLIDPPWSYYGQQDKWGAAAKFYETQSDEWIANLDVRSLIHDNSVVFLWATAPRLDLGVEVLGRWGLTFRGVPFVWVKTRKDGTPLGAQGVRPSIVKPTCEFVLAGSLCKRGRPLPVADESVCQTVFAPRKEHSAKPVEVQERIEALYPGAQRLELFARTRREGWDAWGNELR